MNCSVGVFVSCASSTRWRILARDESWYSFWMDTFRTPSLLMLPPNTASPGCFSTGIASPVMAASFTELLPDSTIPSDGIFCPDFTRTMSPTLRLAIGTTLSSPPFNKMASFGATFSSSSMERRAFSMPMPSRSSLTPNRMATSVPSFHSPMEKAPMRAMVMSVSMLNFRRNRFFAPLMNVGYPLMAAAER